MANTYRYYIWPILSGLIAALAYSCTPLSFLVFLAFVPFFHGLNHSTSKRTDLMYGFIGGLVYFLLVYRWLWGLYPLDTLGINSGVISALTIFGIWLISCAAMAMAWALFATILGFFFRKKLDFWLLIPLIPSLFITCEYLRSYIISILWHGPGTLIGPHWTIGNPAYALSNNPLMLRLASYTGMYGVLFVIIFLNVLVWIALRPHDRRRFRIKIVRLVIVSVVTVSHIPFLRWNSPEAGTVPVAIVQTQHQSKIYEPPSETIARFKEQAKLFETAARSNAEIIALPEGSGLFRNLSSFIPSDKIKKYFTTLSPQPKLIIDNSQLPTTGDKRYSRTLFLNTKTAELTYYDKKLITPGGEFMPYLARVALGLIAPQTKEQFVNHIEYSTGTTDQIAHFNGYKLSAAICSDSMSPSIIRDKAARSDILIAMASTAIFHGNEAIIQQNLAANRFRAAENNIPILLAANYGKSYSIDRHGTVRKITTNQDPQIFTDTVSPSSQRSVYNRVGNWPIFSVVAAVFLISLGQVLAQKIDTRKN